MNTITVKVIQYFLLITSKYNITVFWLVVIKDTDLHLLVRLN